MNRRPSSFSTKKEGPRAVRAFLGVDVVEYRKARLFYVRHKNRLGEYFGKNEVAMIRKSHKPYESLALLLAAKEAVFKSSALPWMGAGGFRKIQILSQRSNRLSFRLKGNFKKGFARRPAPMLSYLKGKDFVIAECRSSASKDRPECAGN